MSNNDCAILVNSCDSYCDLWDSFFKLLKINWPEVSNYNIYLNTESTKNIDVDLKINCITTNLKNGDMWGKRLLHSLNEIKEKYVIVLMDDFFLRNKVSEDKIYNCLDAMEGNDDIAVFYMRNLPGKTGFDSEFSGFIEIPKGELFRLNSAPGIWNKQKLIEYSKDSDNPWAWECFGSCRTDKKNDRFFCMNDKEKPLYDYAHAIYRGKWLEKDINPLLEKYDLDIDISSRGLVKNGEQLPKRGLKWKINFISTGIKMVGLDAIKVLIKGKKRKKNAIKNK